MSNKIIIDYLKTAQCGLISAFNLFSKDFRQLEKDINLLSTFELEHLLLNPKVNELNAQQLKYALAHRMGYFEILVRFHLKQGFDLTSKVYFVFDYNKKNPIDFRSTLINLANIFKQSHTQYYVPYSNNYCTEYLEAEYPITIKTLSQKYDFSFRKEKNIMYPDSVEVFLQKVLSEYFAFEFDILSISEPFIASYTSFNDALIGGTRANQIKHYQTETAFNEYKI